MDQLTKGLQRTQIMDNTTRSSTNGHVQDEAAQADKLIRELYRYAETKIKSTNSRKKRNLVYASKFELDLEKEPQITSTRMSGTTKLETLTITAWKMNDFEYAKGTLPTLARGLFTYRDPTMQATNGNAVGTNRQNDSINRILIRGYDKFFNVGEVEKTKLEWIAENTEGPYEVTLKENGCIIFMAGLPPHLVGPQGDCVISSKHVLASKECKEASTQGDEMHAAKGREWVERTLATKGKTLQEFGLWLWNQNLTAIAELCDDSFEEHVLQYPAEIAGLYLHGLNRNTVDFQTLPSSKVQEVAKEWGFRSTDYVTFNSHQEVMDFAEKVRNVGEYDNRAVEGFVVRCRTKQDNEIHFFKIKYDEPYLMYREWREVTKHLWGVELKKAKMSSITATATSTSSEEHVEPMTARMKYPLTRVYVAFVKNLMQKQPELFLGYNKNQGIIAIRDMFLKEWESKSPKELESLLVIPSANTKNSEEDFQRTVLIPIATIGCGKTTVSVALSKLFGWAHVSSDDFHHLRKNSGQKFIQEIVNQLQDNLVVIADRNNFEFMHRERIMAGVREKYPKTRFVALHWSHDDLPITRIREMEIERVKSRGNNHQSMTPEYCPEFEIVIQTFLKSFEPINPMIEPDSNFSYVVECKVGEDSLVFVKRIVQEFAIPTLGAGGIGNHAVPAPKDIKEAVRYALEDWKPKGVISGDVEKFHQQKKANRLNQKKLNDTESTESSSSTTRNNTTSATPATSAKARKAKDPKYFAIALEAGAVPRFMDEITGSETELEDSPELTMLREQYNAWKEDHRIGIYQHVTLVHASARKDSNERKARRAEELWKLYTEEIATVSTTSSTPTTPSTSTEQSMDLASSSAHGEFITVDRSGRRGKTVAMPDTTAVMASAEPAAAISSAGGGPERIDLQATVTVDHIIWTKRIILLRVSNVKRATTGIPYANTQQYLHVTVGTGGDTIKPFESNEVMRLWCMKNRPAKPEIYAFKLDNPKVFTGHLKAMLF
ncbi:hypothetical protein BGZ65_002753 [Modicella reniformis]|uniref:tRNA ligase n=1 Tax=Modicella reniformis TaxID=1440133 RepID=A0A9P6J8B8_9FUNG|nr:hypothetical protein BGZ65_002753 [Modicella reniformis]